MKLLLILLIAFGLWAVILGSLFILGSDGFWVILGVMVGVISVSTVMTRSSR